MIFAGYAGVGKSTCASMRSDVLDLPLAPFKYGISRWKREIYEEQEALKATDQDTFDLHYPEKYVDVIERRMKNYKHILIPTDVNVLQELDNRKIPYFTVVPNLLDERMKHIYEQRYRSRGNNERFIDIFIGEWEQRIGYLIFRFKPYVLLNEDTFMSDIVQGYDEGRLV